MIILTVETGRINHYFLFFIFVFLLAINLLSHHKLFVVSGSVSVSFLQFLWQFLSYVLLETNLHFVFLLLGILPVIVMFILCPSAADKSICLKRDGIYLNFKDWFMSSNNWLLASDLETSVLLWLPIVQKLISE